MVKFNLLAKRQICKNKLVKNYMKSKLDLVNLRKIK